MAWGAWGAWVRVWVKVWVRARALRVGSIRRPLILPSLVLARPGVFRYMADLSRYRAGAQAALQLVLEGARVPVGGTYALEEAATAHAALEAGQTTGALLLRP